jgi:hypothetical protein
MLSLYLAPSVTAKGWENFSPPLICCKLRQERQVKLAVANQNAVKRRHALQVIFVRGDRK